MVKDLIFEIAESLSTLFVDIGSISSVGLLSVFFQITLSTPKKQSVN
jgi:hypothetical protein